MLDPTFYCKEKKTFQLAYLGTGLNEKENKREKWENYIKKENTIN